jgi:hypothetical protein
MAGIHSYAISSLNDKLQDLIKRKQLIDKEIHGIQQSINILLDIK